MTKPVIFDASGRPVTSRARGQSAEERRGSAHLAGDRFSRELSNWHPRAGSPDADLLPELGDIRARSRDLIRNHGFASGAVQTHLDNVIGSHGLRLVPSPNWQALGITQEVAAEWSRTVKREWQLYAYSTDCAIDAGGRGTFAGLLAQMYRSELANGEGLLLVKWRPRRPGIKWGTCFHVMEPDRLSNPFDRMDQADLRGGIEIDEDGRHTAYHIRSSHPGDQYYTWGSKLYEWTRIPARQSWGRRNVIHSYDEERPDQARGKPRLAPVIEALKMLSHYERTEMQAAIINSMFAAYIESIFDKNLLGDETGGDVSPFQSQRADFYQDRDVMLDGARIPTLFPGDKLTFANTQRPFTNFAAFEEATLRNVAAGANLTYEQVSRDYSKTNYSSARAAMIESWKFFAARRATLGHQVASQIYAAWLEEAMENGIVPAISGAPEFWDAPAAWVQCRWIGMAQGWIDPQKEIDAALTRISGGLSTFENECAAQGEDWHEMVEQQAIERAKFVELGLPYPGAVAPAAAPQPAQPYASDIPGN